VDYPPSRQDGNLFSDDGKPKARAGIPWKNGGERTLPESA